MQLVIGYAECTLSIVARWCASPNEFLPFLSRNSEVIKFKFHFDCQVRRLVRPLDWLIWGPSTRKVDLVQNGVHRVVGIFSASLKHKISFPWNHNKRRGRKVSSSLKNELSTTLTFSRSSLLAHFQLNVFGWRLFWAQGLFETPFQAVVLTQPLSWHYSRV